MLAQANKFHPERIDYPRHGRHHGGYRYARRGNNDGMAKAPSVFAEGALFDLA